MDQHKQACTRLKENCKTCRLEENEMKIWDDAMRGKALAQEYGEMTADEIFTKLNWQKSPPRQVTTKDSITKNTRAQDLIEKYQKRRKLDGD